MAYAQGFNKRYDAFGWGNAQGSFGIEYHENGYVVIGGSYDTDSLAPDFFLSHVTTLFTFIDLDGNMVDERRTYRPLHGTYVGWTNCCDSMPGGGYIVGGSSENLDGLGEVYLMRFNVDGDTLWTRVFGDPNMIDHWIGRQVKRTADGGFIIVGDTHVSGQTNAFALKTDAQGNELWRETYPQPWIDYLSSIDYCPISGWFCGGQKRLSANNQNLWVIHINNEGELQWQVNWGTQFDEPNAHMITLADGNIFIASGWGYAHGGTSLAPYLAKLDGSNGEIIWDKEYGSPAWGTTFFAGKETASGDLIACGVSYVGGGQQGLLLRTTSEGDSLWMFRYLYQDSLFTNGTGRFFDVLPTPDGGFIAAGDAYNPAGIAYPPGTSQDTWVVKVDALGCIIPGCNSVGITEQATNLLDALRIWPNPVQSGGHVHVELDLPPSVQTKDLELSIVSMDGKVVYRQALTAAGNSPSHSITLSLSHLSPSLYNLHITNGSTWLTGGKLVVD